ncbi:MAG TPA: hypothetical protein VEI94_13135 [Candidatus Bathyarchaeia archaeon]|nr:hypothetical protein [Candidatus Bathyarchaeia archaeon]
MASPVRSFRGIKDIFYETRAMMGREFTLRRFAREILGGEVEAVMLGYIETGKRLPSEALVRRLAVARKEDPQGLLVLLWRDRILYGFAKELRRIMGSPRAISGIEDATLAVVVSQAIAALPDDGGWVPIARWRGEFHSNRRRRGDRLAISAAQAKQVEEALKNQELIETRDGRVRRLGRHFIARDTEERLALSLEFCTLFTKGLLDKLALANVDTGTYLRNHYLNIDPAKLPLFQQELEQTLRKLAEKFAADATSETRFLNVLVTSTTL